MINTNLFSIILNCFSTLLMQISPSFYNLLSANSMLIPLVDLQMIYSKIVQDLHHDSTSALLLAAFDIDSMATMRILTEILNNSGAMYEMVPVGNYTQLEKRIESSRRHSKLRMVFFINCGGAIDLTQTWFIKDNPGEIKIFLLDIHKPIHHSNIDCQHIKIVDDHVSGFDKCPTSNEIKRIKQLEREVKSDVEKENEENEGSVENEEDEEEKGKKKKKKKTIKKDAYKEDWRPPRSDQNEDLDWVVDIKPKQVAEIEELCEEDLALERKKKRQKERIRIEQKKEKDEINRKIYSYYRTQFTGMPSSIIAYKLAYDVNQVTSDILWYAILGITALYREDKTSKSMYDWCQALLSSEVTKRMPVGGKSSSADDINKIFPETDFKLVTMKKWTISNSLKFSPYVVPRMRLWGDEGEKKVKEIVSQIGLSLQEAQNKTKYLSTGKMNQTKADLAKVAEKFGLLDIGFISFERRVGEFSSQSASDWVCAMMSYLQFTCPKTRDLSKMCEFDPNHFWSTYTMLDAIDPRNMDDCLKEYQEMMMLLTKQSVRILEKNEINLCQKFLYVKYIAETSQKQQFFHPYKLARLAKLLMQLFHEKKATNKKFVRPLLISVECQKLENCMLLGVMPDLENSFGQQFVELTERLKIERKHDLFLSNVMEIKKSELIRFIATFDKK